MQEEKYDVSSDGGIKFTKGRFAKWFENFWYHYKWHTLVSLFVIFVLAICIAQCSSKPDYDAYFVYAGSGEVRGNRTENDISEYEKICKSLNEAVEDFDDNGEVLSSLEAIYLLSEKEIIEKQESVKGTGNEFNYDRTNEDDFRNRLYYSDVYIFLISDKIYGQYQVTEQGTAMFSPIRDLAKAGSDVVFYDDSAVYLHSTKFGELPGLCDLPDDTLITLRSIGALSSHFDKDATKADYENAKKVVANMINYGK